MREPQPKIMFAIQKSQTLSSTNCILTFITKTVQQTVNKHEIHARKLTFAFK